jgi:hypothetical protein
VYGSKLLLAEDVATLDVLAVGFVPVEAVMDQARDEADVAADGACSARSCQDSTMCR